MGNLEHLNELKMTLIVSLDCNIGREIENKRKKLAEIDQFFQSCQIHFYFYVVHIKMKSNFVKMIVKIKKKSILHNDRSQ